MRTFAEAAIGFSRARLARAAVGQLCRSVLDPKAAAESMKRLFVLRKIRNWQTRRVILDVAASPSFGGDRVQDRD